MIDSPRKCNALKILLSGLSFNDTETHDGGQRSLATLLSLFGMLAVALTCVGVYGMMSQAVRRRSRELGIRMALGAQGRGVVDGSATCLAPGVARGGDGIPVAAAGSRILAHELFGVRVGDPTTLAIAVLGIALSAAVAAAIPGFRASRIDPMDVLRHE